ncbi:PEP-CTERM sorting domain-containing protein [Cognaticolwellia beringensis]|uniref:PEP-CTERM sorting domain-containing protein n=1 Tax=Cognaticolwellia beringensis TaxID=1967665 RepID=A0A222G7P6_9GAMM|nr:PEP-CTERM sorting domain-containing protein [Cognaticolwellia beringensis]ASP47752.1 PEP-CTERM sorting domain-containing protein [Cognaticolwellia beringensis]
MNNNKNIVQKVKNSIWSRVVLGAMLVGMSMSSQASLVGFDLQDSPDISALSLETEYDATSDEFTAKGYSSELNYNGFTYQLSGFGQDYELEATIDDNGVFTSGSISIGGWLTGKDGSGDNIALPTGYTQSSNNTLVTGVLSQFGFENSGTLYFLFEVTGGDAAGFFGGINSIGAIILASSGFSGDWMSDFSSNSALSDNGLRVAVPEPTSMWLLGSGILGLAGFSRRKKNK